MFPPKSQNPSRPPHGGGDGLDEESSLKDEILAELIEKLEEGLGTDLDKKAKPQGVEIDILAAEEPAAEPEGKPLDLNLDEEDEEEGF